ncbi:MAG: ATP-binding protein [Porticoccaceae bacterium]|nr:ATP-binding protein [Porticoccaceae bacterium]
MSTQLNLFDELTFYEGVDVEYKAAKGGLPGDLWETYSAFANTEGGTIWLGISQRANRLDIHGVPHPEKLVTDFWNTVNNRGKVNSNLLGERDVEILPVHDSEARVVRIWVPRADRRQRPIFIGSDPFRGTYRRGFEGDYRCTEQEVRRMFADQSDEPADGRVLEGFSLQDLHLESLRQFRNRFASIRPGHAWLAEDDVGLLVKLGGWRRDRVTGKEGLTLAGLLMFGRDEAIRDPAAVPGYHVDYRERFSDDPSVRWTDRLTLDGTWEGNLFQFYQQVTLKLSSGPGIKRPFKTNEQGYRIAASSVGEALQEALVNALIHSDYSGQGGIVIDRYLDRFEFSNPGTLLVSRRQLLQGGISECRNKSLQLMFQMLGVGDKAGSGIDKIRSSWAAEHWQSPSLTETYQPDRVVLDLPMISTLPDQVLSDLGTCFGDKFQELNAEELQAVVTAYLEESVTNQRLQDMLTLHRVDITRMLRGLVKSGFLVSDGVGRGTRYQLNLPEVRMEIEGALPAVVSAPPLSNGAPPLSNGAPPLSNGAPPLSGGAPPLTDEAPRFVDEAIAIQAGIPADDERWALAAHVRSKKRVNDKEVLRAAIRAVCARDFLTLQQVGLLVARKGLKNLQEDYLGPMAHAGQLELRYPDKPNHPQQAYRTSRSDTP